MPPKKKAKKDDQIKDQSAAQQVILDYLKQQFRPYATNDILLNLHNKIPKAVLLKALAALVDEDKLLMKAYGKLNFYVFKYSDDEKQEAKTDDGKDITLDLINGLKETYAEMNNEVKELANEYKTVTQEPSNDDLQSQQASLKSEIEKLTIQRDALSAKVEGAPLDEKQLIQITKQIAQMEKHCKSRKKDYLGIVSLLKENVPNYQTILDEAGVEDVSNK